MNESRFLKADERQLAIQAHKEGKLGISRNYHTSKTTGRIYAEEQGWSLPLFGFKSAFIRKMLESDESFRKVISESPMNVYISNA